MADLDGGYKLASNDRELVHQIRHYFRNFKVTEYDLKAPTSAFVIEFYKMFLNEFFIDPNSVMQIQMSQATVLGEYSDMYNDMIPLVNLTAAVKKFCIPALTNFTVYDLINPTPRRTFGQMSHVMIFIMFADSRVASLEPKLAQIKETGENKQNILQNIDKMKQEYNARLIEITGKKSAIEEKDAQIEKIKTELDEMCVIKSSLTEQLTVIKAQLNECSSRFKENSDTFQTLQNDTKDLNQQIKKLKISETTLDPSTESLSFELLQEKAQETSEQLRQTREDLTQKQKYCDDLNKTDAGVVARLYLAKEITQFIESNIEYTQKYDELNQSIETLTKNIHTLKSDICSTDEKLKEKNEELIGLGLQWKKQKLSLEESVNVAKTEYESQEKINLTKQNELHQINEAIEYYKKKMAENERAYNILIDHIEERHRIESMEAITKHSNIINEFFVSFEEEEPK